MPRADGLPRHDMDLGEMPVERRPAAFMLDDDGIAVAVDPSRVCDDAGSGRDDGRVVILRDVDARMEAACACDGMDAPAERRRDDAARRIDERRLREGYCRKEQKKQQEQDDFPCHGHAPFGSDNRTESPL